ncbi:MAG: glycosyltransferase family 4 protein [Verrucomicrobia bacterium]|nr:glycosyltransferase family 4 protein [Verrucomicrobiota bacterium]
MKVAFITTDNRENERQYHLTQPAFGSAPEALLSGFRELKGITVHVISCTQRVVQAPEKLADNLYFHSLHVPKFGWLRTGYQGCIRATRSLLRTLRPDVVHGQGTERDCGIAAVMSGLPNVITIHGNMRLIAKLAKPKTWSYLNLAALLEGPTVRMAGGVVCISRYTQAAVSGIARRTWLVPNAVYPSFFDVERRPADPPLILCVGVISRRKNQLALLTALDRLAPKFRFRARFIGPAFPGDPYGQEFLSRAARAACVDEVRPMGRDDLRETLKRASLLVLPSLEDNCPMVILEAAAAGVPVLASRVGGIPEYVEDRVNGSLFDPNEPHALAERLAEFLTDRQPFERAAIEARRRAIAEFHPRVIATRHVDVYHQLLESPMPACA